MTLSRRSFLKVAGLTVVAAAGASMFTGCSVTSLFMTPVTYVAAPSAGDISSIIDELNKNNATKGVPGSSSKYSNKPDTCKSAVENQLRGAVKLNVEAAKNIEVVSAQLKEKDENGKKSYYIEATVKKSTTTSGS